jgi:hypothetical protein
MRAVLPAALAYFALVFATGFVLGTVRVLWLLPRLGERWAELAELPVMLAASALAARWVVDRFALVPAERRLATGLIAFVLLVGFELTVVLAMRGLTLVDYLASRDPVSGTAYVAALAIFAMLPLAFHPRTDGGAARAGE